MTEDDVRELLRKEAGYRGVNRWCAVNGVSQSYAAGFLRGERGAGPVILSALGLETFYRIKRKRACVEPEPGL